jgi:hypothetical protein
MLFPQSVRENLYEETVQIDELTGTAGMAPFVKVGQKAVIMDSQNGTGYTITTPYISIKRPLTYSSKLSVRLAGSGMIFNQGNQGIMRQVIRQEMAKDVDYMGTLIDNRLEWMAAKILTGTLSYSVDGQDSFTISTGKPSGNTFTAPALWSTTCNPLEDIRTVKGIVAGYRGPIPNVAICGALAAAALRTLISSRALKLDPPAYSGVDSGRANLLSRIQEDGMIFMGTIGDVDFWEYLGTYPDDTTGVETPLIRTDYIEFFSIAPKALSYRKMYFGLIPDIKAIMAGRAVTERYMTSKEPDEDSGTYEGIIKTRPFPWLQRSCDYVSMKVV